MRSEPPSNLQLAAGHSPYQTRYDRMEHIPCAAQPCNSPYIMIQLSPHPLKWWDAAPICESMEVYNQAQFWNCWYSDNQDCVQ
jgi:hypothetical protein